MIVGSSYRISKTYPIFGCRVREKMNGKWKSIILILLFTVAGFIGGITLSSYIDRGGIERQSITVTGSTTVLPIAKAAANQYMQMHADVVVSVSGGGSGHGYSEITSGKANIGLHSRKPEAQEIQDAEDNNVYLTLYAIGIDALTVIVNPSVVPEGTNTLTLTRRQIGQIVNHTVPDEAYEITTWGDVEEYLGVTVADNAKDKEITVFDREAGSGTRGVLLDRCVEKFGYEIDPDTSGVGSNKQMRQNVQDTKWSIGYLGLGYLASGVKAVNIKESAVTFVPSELAYGGSGPYNLSAYPLSRELYMSTDGIYWKLNSLVSAFLNFVMSEGGGVFVEEEGFFDIKGERIYSWSTVQTWA